MAGRQEMRSGGSISGFPVAECGGGRAHALTRPALPQAQASGAAPYLVVLMAEQIRKNFQHQACHLGTHVLPFRKDNGTKHDVSKLRSTVSSQANLSTNLGPSANELCDPG